MGRAHHQSSDRHGQLAPRQAKPGVWFDDTDEALDDCIAEALAAEEGGEALFEPHAPPEFIARIRACILGQD